MDDEMLLVDTQEIDQLTDRLSDLLRDSEEYKRYKDASERIRQDHDLYNRVNELRRNNYYLQNSGYGKMTQDEFMNISRLSRSLRENALVSEFLNAEVELARKIQSIARKLMRNIDFDIDFL